MTLRAWNARLTRWLEHWASGYWSTPEPPDGTPLSTWEAAVILGVFVVGIGLVFWALTRG